MSVNFCWNDISIGKIMVLYSLLAMPLRYAWCLVLCTLLRFAQRSWSNLPRLAYKQACRLALRRLSGAGNSPQAKYDCCSCSCYRAGEQIIFEKIICNELPLWAWIDNCVITNWLTPWIALRCIWAIQFMKVWAFKSWCVSINSWNQRFQIIKNKKWTHHFGVFPCDVSNFFI